MMKHATQKKLALAIIAVSLLFLFYRSTTIDFDPVEGENNLTQRPTESSAGPSPNLNEPNLNEPILNEKVIYTCRFADEEIPGVQISEVTDDNGQILATQASAAYKDGLEITAPGVSPTWDYKSVAARAGNNVIEVAFDPQRGRSGDDWILTLAGENTYFQKRVRDCTEVSDE